MLARNAWAGGYELDLVVRRGRRLVFVEVKERGAGAWSSALAAVDEEKQRRLRHAAEAWLAVHRECRGLTCSFDVVTVEGGVRRVARAF